MSRKPDERIEKARELFLQGMKLIDIARQLDLPEGTIRSWKNRQKWDCNVAIEKECNVAKRKRGGQPANRNAFGHGAPPRNKNALKTGEFETLFFDTLKEDEKRLAGLLQPDREQLIMQEIRLLTIRERRMLQRIEDIKDSQEYTADRKPADGFTVTKMKIGTEKGEYTDLKEYQGKLGQIQSIEDALTRVQARKQQAIDSLHRYGMDDAKLEIELMKLDLMAAKLDRQETEVEDDGFLDALNADAARLWEDDNEP